MGLSRFMCNQLSRVFLDPVHLSKERLVYKGLVGRLFWVVWLLCLVRVGSLFMKFRYSITKMTDHEYWYTMADLGRGLLQYLSSCYNHDNVACLFVCVYLFSPPIFRSTLISLHHSRLAPPPPPPARKCAYVCVWGGGAGKRHPRTRYGRRFATVVTQLTLASISL